MDRVLRASGATASIVLYDANGNVADADGTNNGSAAIFDSAGASAASGLAATRDSPGTYRVAIPNSLTKLDTYRIDWSWAAGAVTRTTYVELVGGFLFTIADLRAFDSSLASVTAAEAVAKRQIVEEKFERACGVSFTPRGARLFVDGRGSDRLLIPILELSSLVAAKIDGTALTSSELADVAVYPFGMLRRGSGVWSSGNRNVELLVEHGMSAVPEPIYRAGLAYAKHLLTKSALENERATAVFTDLGGYRLSLAGRDGPTGLPEVDAELEAYGALGSGAFA